jgi:hypothetical protein
MATVPSVLLIGDYMVHGGSPGLRATVSPAGLTTLQEFRDFETLRVVPSDAATGAPTATSLNWFPWFDGGYGATDYTMSAATSTTITASGSPGWTVDEHVNKYVTVMNATLIGFQARGFITSNTADTLTISAWVNGSTPTGTPSFFISQGAWRDYHPAPGWVTIPEISAVDYSAKRGGSSWQALGNGVGPDAGLIHRLWSIHNSSPYFQLSKYASVATTRSWATAGSGIRSAFETFKASMDTAWTTLANGDTLSWDLIVLDQSQRDVLSWAGAPGNVATYKADLEAWIAYLRTTLGNASAGIVLVNHDEAINVPLFTGTANIIHQSVAEDGTNIRTVSMAGERLCGSDTGYGLPAETKAHYSASTYWGSYSTKIAKAYELQLAGAAAAYDGGIPLYILIGDSIAVGQIQTAYLTQLDSPTLTAGPRGSEQGIFNRGSGAVEAYDFATNSNTSGTTGAYGGPEVSLMHELELLHPDGFVLIKRASNSSALATELTAYVGTGSEGGIWTSAASGEHWDELEADYAATLQYINTTLGKQADLKGVFVILGTNDAASAGGGAAFTNALPGFVSEIRSTFQTRTSGPDVPIIWRKPQLDTATAIYDEAYEIRRALDAYAVTDAKFSVVNVDALERNVTDDIHETPESSIIDGQRLVASLADVAV